MSIGREAHDRDAVLVNIECLRSNLVSLCGEKLAAAYDAALESQWGGDMEGTSSTGATTKWCDAVHDGSINDNDQPDQRSEGRHSPSRSAEWSVGAFASRLLTASAPTRSEELEAGLRWETVNVTLNRTSTHHPLGIQVDDTDGIVIKIKEIGEGLVSSWNEANPNKSIMCDDVIVEVNGISGCADLMFKECCKRQILHLVVRRAIGDSASQAQAHPDGQGVLITKSQPRAYDFYREHRPPSRWRCCCRRAKDLAYEQALLYKMPAHDVSRCQVCLGTSFGAARYSHEGGSSCSSCNVDALYADPMVAAAMELDDDVVFVTHVPAPNEAKPMESPHSDSEHERQQSQPSIHPSTQPGSDNSPRYESYRVVP